MTKNKLLTPLFIAASAILVGCSSDTIVGRPDKWDVFKIIENAGDKDNKMKNIYDAVKALGDTNANVLTKVLYSIAQNQIGTYDELKTFAALNEPSQEFKNWLNNHTIYKANNESAYIDDSGKKVNRALNDDEKYKVSLEKVKQRYASIKEDIFEKLYDDIKGGSYSTSVTKLFNEQYFLQHLKKELYITDSKMPSKFVQNKMFKVKGKSTDKGWENYVNATSTESNASGYLQVLNAKGESTGIYDDYIARKILPELYKTYLIQTYVKEQRYSSLGRSYARKVNMVTVPATEKYKNKLLGMLKYFAKIKITETNADYDFEDITTALNGYVGIDNTKFVYQLLNNTPTATTNFNQVKLDNSNNLRWQSYIDANGALAIDADGNPTGEVTDVYNGTKLGDLVEKYLKLYNVTYNASATETQRNFTATPKAKLSDDEITAYNDITSNGTYTIKQGLAIKEKEIKLNDMTKDGWFLKNGGLTDLDSTYRDHLFNISTSNLIDDEKKISGTGEEGVYKNGEYVRYFGASNNRKAFLTTSTTSTDPFESIVLIGDKNFYIIEVEEAVKTSKMGEASNPDSYYIKKASTNIIETAANVNKITNEILKINATGDTYKNNANQYYLMISNIIFYDQSVYDYFKSQFPDLFK